MSVDFSKPVRTKSGLPVEIFCTDLARTGYPVVGVYVGAAGGKYLATWTATGERFCNDTSVTDLENVPERYTEVRAVYSPNNIKHHDYVRYTWEGDAMVLAEVVDCG